MIEPVSFLCGHKKVGELLSLEAGGLRGGVRASFLTWVGTSSTERVPTQFNRRAYGFISFSPGWNGRIGQDEEESDEMDNT